MNEAHTLPRKTGSNVFPLYRRRRRQHRHRNHGLEGHGQRLQTRLGKSLGPLVANDSGRLSGDSSRNKCVTVTRLDNRIFLEVLNACLIGREKRRTDPCAFGTKHHCSRDATPIGDAACTKHRNAARDRIDNLRDERHRSDG